MQILSHFDNGHYVIMNLYMRNSISTTPLFSWASLFLLTEHFSSAQGILKGELGVFLTLC